MKLFGLIGYPLGHSFSEKYFQNKFDTERIKDVAYKNFPINSIEKLEEIIDEFPELSGLNVTIPYKEKVINYLDELDSTALEIGAVNTIKFIPGSKDILLKGYNTDVIGFTDSLKTVLRDDIRSALVLGTGGASKAIIFALKKLGIKTLSVSSSGQPKSISYKRISKTDMADHLLIINTTPLGTYPDINRCPNIPYEFITSRHILFDLVYNPEETLFLKKAKESGAGILNGYNMLVGQAEASWKIWNDKE